MIKDKIDSILKNNSYTFSNINFDIYPSDYIKIYDKIDGSVIYETQVNNYKETDEILKLINQNAAKEELVNLGNSFQGPFAVCFYLGKPKEIIESPISVKMNYIS